MNPAAGAVIGAAIAAGYVPLLRGQIRDGEVGIPFGTINPIRVRRDEHPLAFRMAVVAMCALVALVIAGSAIVLLHSVRP